MHGKAPESSRPCGSPLCQDPQNRFSCCFLFHHDRMLLSLPSAVLYQVTGSYRVINSLLHSDDSQFGTSPLRHALTVRKRRRSSHCNSQGTVTASERLVSWHYQLVQCHKCPRCYRTGQYLCSNRRGSSRQGNRVSNPTERNRHLVHTKTRRQTQRSGRGQSEHAVGPSRGASSHHAVRRHDY